MTPAEKARRTRAKNKRKAEREAKRAAKLAAAAERQAAAARRRKCEYCGIKHRDPGKYYECEQKSKRLECTCPPYWHRTRKNGKRWLSHSYTHGCPLAENGNEQARRDFNIRTFGEDLDALDRELRGKVIRPLE